jgi:hypothetical protein
MTTGIYDTRPRKESYSNLCKIYSAPFEDIALNSKYSEVWFPGDGVIQNGKITSFKEEILDRKFSIKISLKSIQKYSLMWLSFEKLIKLNIY